MKYTKSIVNLIAVSVLVGSALASANEIAPPGKVVSKAEVWLPVKTRFSGFALPAGQYQLQHRINGLDHIMAFIQLKAGASLSAPSTHKVMPVMVRCKLEQLSAKAAQTAFYAVAEGDANRAIKLEIKGEKMSHVFPMPVAPEAIP